MAATKTAGTGTTFGPSGPQHSSFELSETNQQRMEESRETLRGTRETWSEMDQGIRVMVGTLVGGTFALVIGIILTGFLFELELVSNFSGPFSDQLTQLEQVLGAAFTFAGLAMLAYAGSIAWSMFGSGRM